MEYKGVLDINEVDHKRKLLKTICAFANTNGGLLIYGVIEEGGIPTEINGISVTDKDDMGQWIEQYLRSNSEPQLPSLQIEFINKKGTEKVFILVKVQRSWNMPHWVSMGPNTQKFYIRRGRYSEEMDYYELKTAFNLSETLADKIKSFREERISSILSDETPIPMKEGAKFMLHLIPINAFYPGQKYDIEKIANGPLYILPIESRHSSGLNYTFEGLINKEMPPKEELSSDSYVHLYRNGIIEAVTNSFLDNEAKTIIESRHEVEIVISMKEYLKVYQELNIDFPVFVFITLVGVKGYQMKYNPNLFLGKHESYIDRNVLATTEILLEKYPENVGNTLKPPFDAIQNAFGFSGSDNYNEEGEWNPR